MGERSRPTVPAASGDEVGVASCVDELRRTSTGRPLALARSSSAPARAGRAGRRCGHLVWGATTSPSPVVGDHDSSAARSATVLALRRVHAVYPARSNRQPDSACLRSDCSSRQRAARDDASDGDARRPRRARGRRVDRRRARRRSRASRSSGRGSPASPSPGSSCRPAAASTSSWSSASCRARCSPRRAGSGSSLRRCRMSGSSRPSSRPATCGSRTARPTRPGCGRRCSTGASSSTPTCAAPTSTARGSPARRSGGATSPRSTCRASRFEQVSLHGSTVDRLKGAESLQGLHDRQRPARAAGAPDPRRPAASPSTTTPPDLVDDA